MTDKQIIINCIHNEEMGKPNAENALCLIDVDDKCCKDVEIRYCYYKQLQRKEQECNEYFELMAIRTEVLAKIANKLGINTAIIENKEIFNKIDQLKRAEQKLEKIKEICKNVMPTGIDEETDKFGDILEIIEE